MGYQGQYPGNFFGQYFGKPLAPDGSQCYIPPRVSVFAIAAHVRCHLHTAPRNGRRFFFGAPIVEGRGLPVTDMEAADADP